MKTLKLIFHIINLVVTCAFLLLEGQFNVTGWLFMLVSLLVGMSTQLVMHEVGHLIGGLLSGYRLLFLKLGHLMLINKGKLGCVIKDDYAAGQCVMIPKKKDKVHFWLYNGGGIMMNFMVILWGLFLLYYKSFYLNAIFLGLLLVGIKKIMLNGIPNRSSSNPNDGEIIRVLKRNGAVRRDYANYLELFGKQFLNEEYAPEDYIYNREEASEPSELVYYNAIRDLLGI